MAKVLAGGVALILGAVEAVWVLASSPWRLRRIHDYGLSSPASSTGVNSGRRLDFSVPAEGAVGLAIDGLEFNDR